MILLSHLGSPPFVMISQEAREQDPQLSGLPLRTSSLILMDAPHPRQRMCVAVGNRAEHSLQGLAGLGCRQ